MGTTVRRFGLLALALLALDVSAAQAQRGRHGGGGRLVVVDINCSPSRIGTYGRNAVALGRRFPTMPRYLYVSTPYPSPTGSNPDFPITPATPPDRPTDNPYLPEGGPTLTTSTGPCSPTGYPYPSPTGDTLRGVAELYRGEAEHLTGIEQARLVREQVRQTAITTRRRLLQEEIEFERMRPKAPDLRDSEMAGELALARRARPGPEVWSGVALNSLLGSVLTRGGPEGGPDIPLGEETLRGLNLRDRSSPGNIGLLKGVDRLDRATAWPAALRERQYDEPRKRLVRNLWLAGKRLKDREAPDRAAVKDLEADYQALSKDLETSVGDLSPSQYIEARRFLKHINDAIRGLSDPRAGTWAPRGKTVAELVRYMAKNGLEFAPATAGDEQAYNALYHALRAFEESVAAR